MKKKLFLCAAFALLYDLTICVYLDAVCLFQFFANQKLTLKKWKLPGSANNFFDSVWTSSL